MMSKKNVVVIPVLNYMDFLDRDSELQSIIQGIVKRGIFFYLMDGEDMYIVKDYNNMDSVYKTSLPYSKMVAEMSTCEDVNIVFLKDKDMLMDLFCD